MRTITQLFTALTLCFATAVSADYQAPAEPQYHVIASTVVDMPLDQAWAKLQDFSLAHNYVEGVTSTEITTELKTGLGASRRVYMGEDYNNETIIDWSQYSFLMRLHNEEAELTPFTVAQFRYTLEELDAGKTKVIMTMSYGLPWGWVGEQLNSLVISGAMQDAIPKVATGLKHFYETGTAATDADRERLLPAVTVEVK